MLIFGNCGLKSNGAMSLLVWLVLGSFFIRANFLLSAKFVPSRFLTFLNSVSIILG